MKKKLQSGLLLSAMLLLGLALSTCKKDPKDPETKPIPETTKVIDESTWQANVISVDSANYTFIFNENISSKVVLKTGDILVSAEGEGYLRKVTNVVQENGEIKIYTEFASLNEAVRDGNFTFNTILSEQNIKKITYLKKGIKIDTTHMKSTEATNIEASIDEYLDNDQKVHVTGNFSMLPSANCELVLGFFKVKKFSIDYEIEEQINLATTLELLNLEYSKEVELVDITFNTIIVYIGTPPLVIPVVIVPEMVIVAGVNMDIESNISTSIHQQMNYSVGILYENGIWTPLQQQTNSFTYQPPTLTANANAKAYIKPQLNFKVYGKVSPYIYGEAYGRLEADLLENPWWALYGGANVGLGVKMEILDQELFNWPKTPFYIFDYEQLIAQSTTPPANLPTITTAPITNIGQSAAIGGGNVTDQGGSTVTVRGVCWSTSQNPSLTDSHVTSGNGTGVFTSNITGLSANTTYYVRAYAINTDGVGYGNQVQFTTIGAGEIPTVTTNSITNITETSASGGGNVTSDGGTSVTTRGVCWSTSQNPTITDEFTTDGDGTGSFTSSLTGLAANTAYYVRAYATNSSGTAYGEQESFTTTGSGTIPLVTTSSISDITQLSATGGGNVTSDGGTSVTARGICYSTSTNPDLTDLFTTNGTGTGNFTSNLTGLIPSTNYYVRAYATNSVGTAFGENVSFTTLTGGSVGTVTDFDGNVYTTVIIGTQEWMDENLKVTHYRNGEPIQKVTDGTQWSDLTTGAYCWYDNDEPTYGETYGALYNWFTVDDSRNLCPTGWHVPSDGEWTTLSDYLGGTWEAGVKMKSSSGWNNNGNGTNESGFTALPGGERTNNGTFYNIGNRGIWCSTSTTEDVDFFLWHWLQYNLQYLGVGWSHKTFGTSVRCVRD
jgi:uncharacterized protein (TIGR02145 family)